VPPPPSSRAVTTAPAVADKARAKKPSFKEKQEHAGMEAAIAAAEAEVTRLEAALQDPALYTGRSIEVPALVAALEAARLRVEQLYARWQELEGLF
jgi:ATP-binding cassette subfamily F protein uup